jgi:hypothetical protein
MSRLSLASALAALTIGSAFAGPATGASAQPLAARCPADAKGPAYTLVGHTTHSYAVEVQGVSCVFASPWVSKLVNQSRFGRLRGPAGWTCIVASKTNSRLAVDGGCGPGKFSFPSLPAKGFGWYPDLHGH